MNVSINKPTSILNVCLHATPLFPYIHLVVSHKHGEVGEVAAGACGVRAVGVQQPAALRRPLPRHGALRVVPERTIWRVIVLVLQKTKSGDEDVHLFFVVVFLAYFNASDHQIVFFFQQR